MRGAHTSCFGNCVLTSSILWGCSHSLSFFSHCCSTVPSPNPSHHRAVSPRHRISRLATPLCHDSRPATSPCPRSLSLSPCSCTQAAPAVTLSSCAPAAAQNLLLHQGVDFSLELGIHIFASPATYFLPLADSLASHLGSQGEFHSYPPSVRSNAAIKTSTLLTLFLAKTHCSFHCQGMWCPLCLDPYLFIGFRQRVSALRQSLVSD